MAISSQSTPRLLISQVGILASLEKTIPMGQLCRCAFHWYLLQLAISPVTSCENSCFKSFWKSIFSGGNAKNLEIGCPFYTRGHNSLIFVDALNQGWWSHLKAEQSVAFGQLKCIYYISRSYRWRQCVQPLKAFKTNSTQKNSYSIRQHHCVRLSEQTGGGERIPPSLAQLGLLQSLKYTHNRHILGCLKVILNISPEGIVWRILAYYNPWNILLRDRNILGLLKCHTQWSLQKGQK